jgi:hypothetical protein
MILKFTGLPKFEYRADKTERLYEIYAKIGDYFTENFGEYQFLNVQSKVIHEHSQGWKSQDIHASTGLGYVKYDNDAIADKCACEHTIDDLIISVSKSSLKSIWDIPCNWG